MEKPGTWERVGLSSSPQHLYTGDGASREIGSRLVEIGIPAGRVAVISDADVRSLGLTSGVRASLEAGGYAPDEYGEIRGEPDEESAERLIAWTRSRSAVAVVGVGGGSAMDLAKLAAAMATNPGRAREYVGAGKVRVTPLPLVLVPTTAGTGSEATRNTILSVDGYKAVISSPLLEPLCAVLDPLLTVGLPPKVTSSTGLDALTHAIEPFLSIFASPFTDQVGLVAMQLLAEALPNAYRDGTDLDARRSMLLGAYLAGLALNASTLLGHSIAYTIANRTHLPHGVTCAMALPYCVAYNAQAAPARTARISRTVTGREGASAEDLVVWAAAMNRQLGIPESLEAVGLRHSDVSPMAEECLDRYPRPNNPEPLERSRLTRLYEYLLTGDIEALAQRMVRQ
jgi:alcohol dehydrogenase class IV